MPIANDALVSMQNLRQRVIGWAGTVRNISANSGLGSEYLATAITKLVKSPDKPLGLLPINVQNPRNAESFSSLSRTSFNARINGAAKEGNCGATSSAQTSPIRPMQIAEFSRTGPGVLGAFITWIRRSRSGGAKGRNCPWSWTAISPAAQAALLHTLGAVPSATICGTRAVMISGTYGCRSGKQLIAKSPRSANPD
jgi:hypothetical protein